MKPRARIPSMRRADQDSLLDVGESDQPIPLPNVSSAVLKKVGCSIDNIDSHSL